MITTEKDIWMQEAFEAAKTQTPMAHKERYAFNYGVHMGIEIAKIKAVEKFQWFLEQMREKTKTGEVKFSDREIDFLQTLIDIQHHLGDKEVK